MKYVLLPAETGTKVYSWFVPPLQVHCRNCAAATVVQSFSSMHWPLPWLTRVLLNPAENPGVREIANASCEDAKVIGTAMEPLDVLSISLVTTRGELSGDWSGIRYTVTLTLPLFASHGTDDNPLKVTLAAPVNPFSSPMTATARRFELSSAAEIAVVPTSPEVETREPVRSA